MRWWDVAVRSFALLTTPRADVTRCDRDVVALARDSRVGRAVQTAGLVLQRAWTASRTQSAMQTLAAAVVATSGTTQWRVAGWIAAVAGATAFALNPLATRDGGRLIWVTPALLVTAGLLVMTCAAPLARAAADRRRRSSSSTQ